MGRKRKRSNIDGARAADTILDVSLIQDPEILDALKAYGLPLHFGTLNQDEKEPFDEQEQLDKDHSVQTKQSNKAKRKRRRKWNGPYLSEHFVEEDAFVVSELFQKFPQGLNYTLPVVPNGHLFFDTEGNSTVDTTEASLEESSLSLPSNLFVESPLESSIIDIPPSEKMLKKYHRQRYDLFHLFDSGIQIDSEGWFSVTPELIALHTAQSVFSRNGMGLVWDAFAGVGGNSIQFAMAGMHVLATDLDPNRLRMAKHNATIYKVDQYIDFVIADVCQPFFRKNTTFDCVFLSPPWGGPNYLKLSSPTFDPLSMLPIDLKSVSELALRSSDDVIFYLPRNTEVTKLAQLLSSSLQLIVERHYLDERFKVVIIHCIRPSE